MGCVAEGPTEAEGEIRDGGMVAIEEEVEEPRRERPRPGCERRLALGDVTEDEEEVDGTAEVEKWGVTAALLLLLLLLLVKVLLLTLVVWRRELRLEDEGDERLDVEALYDVALNAFDAVSGDDDAEEEAEEAEDEDDDEL